MSWVTSVILKVPSDETEKISIINEFFGDKQRHHFKNELCGDGPKVIQPAVYAAAYNYLSIPDFVRHIFSISWEEKDELQVFINDENDDNFTLIDQYNWHLVSTTC